jgi:hypothetical protein
MKKHKNLKFICNIFILNSIIMTIYNFGIKFFDMNNLILNIFF